MSLITAVYDVVLINEASLIALTYADTTAQLSKDDIRKRQNQLILLGKVKTFWVDGLFVNSSIIDLNWTLKENTVDNPFKDLPKPMASSNYVVNASTNLLSVFRQSSNALLILGEAGSGKTFSLVRLLNQLVALAELDPYQPIPILLNLSSWGEQRLLLDQWIVEEMAIRYQIPRKYSRSWLEDNDLICLLDGFDEVKPRQRDACLQAINTFRETHGLVGIVVCSRTDDYEQCTQKLKVGQALQMLPLTDAQFSDYLAPYFCAKGGCFNFLMQREGISTP